jgi:hypothetical protein
MTSVKDRGNDAPIQTEKSVDIRRLANVGKEVELSFGTVTVKDIGVRALLKMSDDLFALVNLFSSKAESNNWAKVLSDDKFFETLTKLLSAATNEPSERYNDLTVTEIGLLISALREVIDWEKLKEVFSQLGLTEILKSQNPVNG